MRLINIDTLELEEFSEPRVPAYAVLSHRWGKNELQYAEYNSKKSSRAKARHKILACAQTLRDYQDNLDEPVRYVWIDTCCIDRRNSAELSEAINAMFSWYASAKLCLVYLKDVNIDMLPEVENNPATLHEALAFSSWMHRGWTLQELLAPRVVTFFDKDWQVIGHKCSTICGCRAPGATGYGVDLNAMLAAITGVDRVFLSGEQEIDAAPISKKMGWAAWRRTTKPEDEAYCLVGLFGVNIPILYGIGRDRAFYRLQEELLRSSSDQTLLAWTVGQHAGFPKTHMYCNRLLAPSVMHFLDSGAVGITTQANGLLAYSMRNGGVELRANAFLAMHRAQGRMMTIHIIRLSCLRATGKLSEDGQPLYHQVEIALTDGTSSHAPLPGSRFHRVFANDLGDTISKTFPEHQRTGPFEHTYFVSAFDDTVLELAKL